MDHQDHFDLSLIGFRLDEVVGPILKQLFYEFDLDITNFSHPQLCINVSPTSVFTFPYIATGEPFVKELHLLDLQPPVVTRTGGKPHWHGGELPRTPPSSSLPGRRTFFPSDARLLDQPQVLHRPTCQVCEEARLGDRPTMVPVLKDVGVNLVWPDDLGLTPLLAKDLKHILPEQLISYKAVEMEIFDHDVIMDF